MSVTEDLAISGFAVRPLLSVDDVRKARAFFDSMTALDPGGVPLRGPAGVTEVTAVHAAAAQVAEVDRWVRAEFGDRVGGLLPGYRPFFATFYNKPASGPMMPFHQDWTYCDERRHRAVIAWIPLVDVDGVNGAMSVVAGSHRWTSGIRPGAHDSALAPTDEHADEFAMLAERLDMRSGDVLLFDAALVHGTPPNRSGAVRPVLGIGLIPEAADLLHFRHVGPELVGFVVPPNRSLMDAASAGTADERASFPPAEVWSRAVESSDFSAGLALARSPLGAAFERDGFVVRPLLDADEVKGLRDRFDQLEVEDDHPRFISSIHCSPDEAVDIDRFLRDRLARRFVDVLPRYRSFFALYLAKGRDGGEEVEFHQDWTYTDERRVRTVSVWIPLVDVDACNGAMAVVVGSHRWVSGIRESDSVIHDEATVPHQASFAVRALTLPMRAGDALFYDPALVHGTPPNVTGGVRPVVSIHFAPIGAEIVHFRRGDDGVVRGFEVPSGRFFMDPYHERVDGLAPVTPWAAPVEPADFDAALASSTSPSELKEGTRSAGLAGSSSARRRWWSRR